MLWYIEWVKDNVLLSAFIQFALLGTAGEALGMAVAKKGTTTRIPGWLAKALVWGLLGILVKYSFTGFKGFLAALVEHGFLPIACEESRILRALCLSALTNSMFGPLLMVLHRTTDNLIARTTGYVGLEKSLATLAWFWLPAHAVTFALPADLQIGLAALWSVALGLIMGFTKRRG